MAHLAHRLTRPLAAAALLGLGGIGAHAMSQVQARAVPALAKTAVAHILVDARGMTLYLYSPDKRGKSVCTGECAAYWPPALVPSGGTVPTTMPGIAGAFGVTTRQGGARQLTYDGAPLYTFVKDKRPGDITGQGVGGIWWAIAVGGATSTTASGQNSGQGRALVSPGATPTSTSGGYYSGGDDHRGGPGGAATAPGASPTPRGYYSGGDG